MEDFIREALRNRRELVKDRRSGREYEGLFSQFVELVCECGIREGDTPSSIVDNWCINGQSGTYGQFLVDYMRDDTDYERLVSMDPEQRENTDYKRIEEEIMNRGFYYDRDELLYHD